MASVPLPAADPGGLTRLDAIARRAFYRQLGHEVKSTAHVLASSLAALKASDASPDLMRAVRSADDARRLWSYQLTQIMQLCDAALLGMDAKPSVVSLRDLCELARAVCEPWAVGAGARLRIAPTCLSVVADRGLLSRVAVSLTLLLIGHFSASRIGLRFTRDASRLVLTARATVPSQPPSSLQALLAAAVDELPAQDAEHIDPGVLQRYLLHRALAGLSARVVEPVRGAGRLVVHVLTPLA